MRDEVGIHMICAKICLGLTVYQMRACLLFSIILPKSVRHLPTAASARAHGRCESPCPPHSWLIPPPHPRPFPVRPCSPGPPNVWHVNMKQTKLAFGEEKPRWWLGEITKLGPKLWTCTQGVGGHRHMIKHGHHIKPVYQYSGPIETAKNAPPSQIRPVWYHGRVPHGLTPGVCFLDLCASVFECSEFEQLPALRTLTTAVLCRFLTADAVPSSRKPHLQPQSP